jgi:hypothetical protein
MGEYPMVNHLPGMEHHLRAKDEIWEYRWYTMDGPLAADIVAGFGLTADIYRVGRAPLRLLPHALVWYEASAFWRSIPVPGGTPRATGREA